MVGIKEEKLDVDDMGLHSCGDPALNGLVTPDAESLFDISVVCWLYRTAKLCWLGGKHGSC